MNSLLEETQGDIKLGDMLQDQSERLVEETLEQEKAALDELIGAAIARANEAVREMQAFESRIRRADITGYYGERFRSYALELKASALPTRAFATLNPKIEETGSDLPRAHLAYYYAILHTIRKFSTSVFCPIVIDTPLQQDQDPENARKMIEFAVNRRPEGSQLILGTVSMHGVPFEGRTINTTDPDALLQDTQYEYARSLIDPLLDAMLSANSLI